MPVPIRLEEVHIDERTYVRFTAELIWSEALRLAAQALLLITAVLPAWWVMVNAGPVPIASLWAWLLPVPLWAAFSHPVGRAATGRSTPWPDVLRTFVTRYPQALLTSLPLLLALNLWVAAANLQDATPSLLVTAGVVANAGITMVLTVVTLHALTVQALSCMAIRLGLDVALDLGDAATWLLIPALL